MTTKLIGTGVQFPDDTVQTTASPKLLGQVYPTKLMNTDTQNTARRHALVVMNDGSVRGWGAGNYYQMGDGYPQDRAATTIVGFPPDFPGAVEVHAANEHASACIDKNGQLWTWGLNNYGQCGVGNTQPVTAPVNVSLITSGSIYGKTVTKVVVPSGIEDLGNIFVLCSDGTMHAVGYNGYGQCGNSSTVDAYYFVRCGTLTGVTDISAGRERYCTAMAVAGGSLYTWGYNGDYQLGTGNTAAVNTPTVRNTGSLVGKTIVKCYGSFFTCYALSSDGILHGAGNQSSGQFGIGHQLVVSTYAQLLTGVKSAYVANFDYPVNVIIKTDNTVWIAGHPGFLNTTWVDDGYGNLTETSLGNMVYWKKLNIPTTINGVAVTPTKAIKGGSGGYNSIYVLMSNGWVYACGSNVQGQLGVGDLGYSVTNKHNLDDLRVVRTGTSLVEDIGVYGEGGETNLLVLTKNKEVRVTGYGASYSNGNMQGFSLPVPGPIRFN